MKNKKLIHCSIGIFHFTFGHLSIGQNGLKRQTLTLSGQLFGQAKKTGGTFCPPSPPPNLAISSKMTMTLLKDILWVGILYKLTKILAMSSSC